MFVSLVKREFRLISRNKAELFGSFCFLLALISVASLILYGDGQVYTMLTSLFCFYFMIILSSNEIFDRDYGDGDLERLSNFDPLFYKIFAAKLFFKIIINLASVLMVAPIMAIFSKIQGELLWQFILLLLVATPFLTVVAVFSSVISLGAYKNSIISIIINFPISCAILLLIASELSNLVKDPSYSLWGGWQIIVALTMVITPIIFVLVGFVFRDLINRLDSAN